MVQPFYGRPRDPNLEVFSFPCGDFQITHCFPKFGSVERRPMFPRFRKSVSDVRKCPPTTFCFPSLGFGKFSRLIDLPKYVPRHEHQLIRDLRNFVSVDLLLGFFPNELIDRFTPSCRKTTRTVLLRRFLPVLEQIHTTRLDFYLYLRSRYELFNRKGPPRPVHPTSPLRRKGHQDSGNHRGNDDLFHPQPSKRRKLMD